MLEQGKVYCEVESVRSRSFDVITDLGTVSVLGTKFTVQVKEDEMKIKEMVAKVIVGMVLITTAGGESTRMQAGENNTKRIKMQPDNGGNLPGMISTGMRSMRKMFMDGGQADGTAKEETADQKALRSLQVQRKALDEVLREKHSNAMYNRRWGGGRRQGGTRRFKNAKKGKTPVKEGNKKQKPVQTF